MGRRMPVSLGADIDPLFSEILTKARDRTAAWGGKFHFIYLPGWARYAKDAQKNDLEIKRRKVVRLVKGLNIPVIDIHQEVFANNPDPLSFFQFRAHAHYTSKGYSTVAKAIVLAVMNDQSPQGL